MGDAAATTALFERILLADSDGQLEKMLKRGSRETYLPMNLPSEHIQQLPYGPGVYYFHDQKDKVIYVGKAKNLRYRVTSHFSNNTASKRKQELIRNVYRISFESCGTEFMAGVLESLEIKRLWPQYNFSQKKWEFSYGLFSYEDQNGFLRLGIERKRKNFLPLYTFSLLLEGHNLLWQLVKQFELCPKLCFLQTDSDPCIGMTDGYCKGACERIETAGNYNERVQLAVQALKLNLPTFALLEDGRNNDEQSCVLLEDGKFYGMGYVPAGIDWNSRDHLKSYLTQYNGNEYLHTMILKHAESHPNKKISI
jgi:DNA polymerase-3 subunit epsilon